MSEPRFPDVSVDLSSGDSNAFFIIGRVSKALRRAGVDAGEIDAFRSEATSGDYDNVLRTAMAWVDVC